MTRIGPSPRGAFVAGCRAEAPRVAVPVAWRTRDVLATIVAGMAALHPFKLVF